MKWFEYIPHTALVSEDPNFVYSGPDSIDKNLEVKFAGYFHIEGNSVYVGNISGHYRTPFPYLESFINNGVFKRFFGENRVPHMSLWYSRMSWPMG